MLATALFRDFVCETVSTIAESGRDFRVCDLGFRRIARLQGNLFLALANDAAERVGDTLAIPKNASDGVSKRASHNKDHVYRRCVTIGRLKVLIIQ